MEESTDTKPCHFLRLPAELRNYIYDLALVSDSPIEIHRKALTCACKEKIRNDLYHVHEMPRRIKRDRTTLDDRVRDHASGCQTQQQGFPQELALTKTCKQIRSESLAVFYGSNIFHCGARNPPTQPSSVTLLMDVYDWARHIGSQRADLVRTIRIGLTLLYGDRTRRLGAQMMSIVRCAYNSEDIVAINHAVSGLRQLMEIGQVRFREGVLQMPLPIAVWERSRNNENIWVAKLD